MSLNPSTVPWGQLCFHHACWVNKMQKTSCPLDKVILIHKCHAFPRRDPSQFSQHLLTWVSFVLRTHKVHSFVAYGHTPQPFCDDNLCELSLLLGKVSQPWNAWHLGPDKLLWWWGKGWPVHCRLFSSTLSLYPIDASGPIILAVAPTNVCIGWQMFPIEAKSPPVVSHCSRAQVGAGIKTT